MKGIEMFLVSPGILKDAKEVAAELIAAGKERGEMRFSPQAPLVVTTDSSKIGDMVSFEMSGKRWYIGFECRVENQEGGTYLGSSNDDRPEGNPDGK